MTPTIRLALIAHDRRKEALADFALDHLAELRGFQLVATRGTGTLLQKRTPLAIRLLEHGLAGGDQQVRHLAEEHGLQAVIFFRDPSGPSAYEPSFAGMVQVCDTQEIPLATNAATAVALLHFLRTSPDRGLIAARAWGRVPVTAGPDARAP